MVVYRDSLLSEILKGFLQYRCFIGITAEGFFSTAYFINVSFFLFFFFALLCISLVLNCTLTRSFSKINYKIEEMTICCNVMFGGGLLFWVATDAPKHIAKAFHPNVVLDVTLSRITRSLT